MNKIENFDSVNKSTHWQRKHIIAEHRNKSRGIVKSVEDRVMHHAPMLLGSSALETHDR